MIHWSQLGIPSRLLSGVPHHGTLCHHQLVKQMFRHISPTGMCLSTACSQSPLSICWEAAGWGTPAALLAGHSSQSSLSVSQLFCHIALSPFFLNPNISREKVGPNFHVFAVEVALSVSKKLKASEGCGGNSWQRKVDGNVLSFLLPVTT